MLNMMYYDTETQEYKLDRDKTASEERYITAFRGEGDFFDEEWLVEHNLQLKVISICYTADDCFTDENFTKNWERIFEENEYKPFVIRHITLPPQIFDEYAERFGLS